MFASRTMIPMAIRTSGKRRPRFRYIAALSTPNQQQESEHDQHRRPEEIPTKVAEHPKVGQQEVGAQHDQNDAGPQAGRPVAIRRSPATMMRRGTCGRGSASGVATGGWWCSACLRPREAGSEVLPDVVANGAQAIANAPRGRRWTACWWLHQEPENQVEEDADAWRHQGQDDEDDTNQKGVNPEIDRQARAYAADNAVRSTSQDAPRRLTHGPAIIACRLGAKKRGRGGAPSLSTGGR